MKRNDLEIHRSSNMKNITVTVGMALRKKKLDVTLVQEIKLNIQGILLNIKGVGLGVFLQLNNRKRESRRRILFNIQTEDV